MADDFNWFCRNYCARKRSQLLKKLTYTVYYAQLIKYFYLHIGPLSVPWEIIELNSSNNFSLRLRRLIRFLDGTRTVASNPEIKVPRNSISCTRQGRKIQQNFEITHLEFQSTWRDGKIETSTVKNVLEVLRMCASLSITCWYHTGGPGGVRLLASFHWTFNTVTSNSLGWAEKPTSWE